MASMTQACTSVVAMPHTYSTCQHTDTHLTAAGDARAYRDGTMAGMARFDREETLMPRCLQASIIKKDRQTLQRATRNNHCLLL
jgi:hypothetical protein